MNNINNEKLFPYVTFTQHDLVATLFALLNRKGINKIDEETLAEKLYYYYQKPEYHELFQDVNLVKNSLIKKVDISEGITLEKFDSHFNQNIYTDITEPNIINLNYDTTKEMPFFANLSEAGQSKILELAQELYTIFKLELDSKYPLHIFNCNPNQSYTLIEPINKKQTKKLSFDIVTDGVVLDAYVPELKENTMVESPYIYGEYITLSNYKASLVSISNATFTMKFGSIEGNIRYAIINSRKMSLDYLKKVLNLSSLALNDKKSVSEESPYIKKITLK